MRKYFLTEVIRLGREEEDKAYREKVAQILKRYGIEEKVWRVVGKRQGQILVEWGEFESQEQADRLFSQAVSDEEWIQLQAEREKAGTIVPGTGEEWILSDS